MKVVSKLENTLKRKWIVLLLFSGLVIMFRFSTFYRSVIDWDESLYILVANQWLEGHLPYTVVWDNKPPGIYLIFASALKLLGHSVVSIRLITCVFITATSYFLYLIGCLFGRNGRGVGLLAGVFYILSTLTNTGTSSNTEIFFTTFVAIAFYWLFSNGIHSERLVSLNPLKLSLIGLCLGCGFQVKQVALFDLISALLILGMATLLNSQNQNKHLSIFRSSLCLTIGFVLPSILVVCFFFLAGNFNEYWYANFTANKLRTSGNTFLLQDYLTTIERQIRNNYVLWLWLFVAPTYLLVKTRNTQSTPVIQSAERWIVLSLLVWFFTDLLLMTVVFKGSFYEHYFLQLAAPLSLISAYSVIRLVFDTEARHWRIRYLILAVILTIVVRKQMGWYHLTLGAKAVYSQKIENIKHWDDPPGVIADYIKPQIREEDYIYVVDNEPIIYFLTKAKIPGQYAAFPPFLLPRRDLPNITGKEPIAELNSVMQKRPVYVIKNEREFNSLYLEQNKYFFAELNKRLRQDYQLERSLEGVNLYRLQTR